MISGRRLATAWVLFLLVQISSAGTLELPGGPDHIARIKWEQRPLFVPDGSPEEKQHAIYERIIQFIHQQPEFSATEHREVIVNHSRFNLAASEGDNCYLGWPTFAEQRIVSEPVTIIRPWVLWTLQSKSDAFGQPGTVVSLERILGVGQIRVGGIENFSYSARILSLMQDYEGKENLYLSPALSIEVNPQLLDLNRVDALS